MIILFVSFFSGAKILRTPQTVGYICTVITVGYIYLTTTQA